MKKYKKFTGTHLNDVPVVLTPNEVARVLQVDEQDVIKLLGRNKLKSISDLSVLRIAAHSLFEFLHDEEKNSNELINGTGFINSTVNENASTNLKESFTVSNSYFKDKKND